MQANDFGYRREKHGEQGKREDGRELKLARHEQGRNRSLPTRYVRKPKEPIGEEEDDPTLPGELCYRDDAGAVCRCFNWRDGQRTALTDDSGNAILVVESLDPACRDDLESALDEFAQLMERYLGAEVVVRAVVDRAHPETVIAE